MRGRGRVIGPECFVPRARRLCTNELLSITVHLTHLVRCSVERHVLVMSSSVVVNLKLLERVVFVVLTGGPL